MNARSSRARMGAVLGGALAVSLALGGCAVGGGGTGGNADGDAEIRFSIWGAGDRAGRMQQVIDAFEAQHTDISVELEYADWAAYWDRLSTSIAAGDAPDVFMQEDRYIGDYARRGVLADLGELGVETADIDQTLLSAGEIDGTLYGIPTGANVMGMAISPQVFADAGVEIPDDTTWTWDDYVDIANEISAALPGTYGTTDYTTNDVGPAVYFRQHGQSLFDEDGALGYDDELMAEWFQRSLDLQRSGGQPPADNGLALPLEDTPLAQGRGAIVPIVWSAQLAPLATLSGVDLEILRIPGESEHDRPGMYFKPGMFVSQSARTSYPEAAATFVDFLVNDPIVGETFGTELGMPANLAVREAITPDLSESERIVADYMDALDGVIVDSPPTLPNGAGEATAILQRATAEVLFERLTPAQAAERVRQELESATAAR